MTVFTRVPLLAACAALAALVPASVSEACWCSRVYTSYYCDPCVSYPVVARSYYVPVATVPVVASCPTTSCSTTSVERCYYQAEISYATQTRLEPYVGYVRSSYYDPFTCCYRSYLVPTTQYVQRSYLVPVTNWVKRCSVEPVTTCAPTTVTASYWTPDGVVYYPVATPVVVSNTACPVPVTNGATQRESGYVQPPDSGKSEHTPQPSPMPAKNDGAKLRRASPHGVAPVARSGPVVPVSGRVGVPARSSTDRVYFSN